MPNTKRDFFDDMSKAAGSFVSIASGLREELRRDMQARLDMLVSRLDLVPRSDFDRLEAQVKQLQKQLAPQDKAKPAAKKAVTTKASTRKKK